MTDFAFIHQFLPGREPNSPVLLLLHGTGGDENDLIPLGRDLLPGAAILSLRGNVLENGMRRFFRRVAEGVFDLEDLKRRTEELARFIKWARREYTLQENRVIAAGYSNGANIAASLILRYPRHVSGAVLFRAMVPFIPEPIPDLSAMKIFLSAGDRDPIVPAANVRHLAAILRSGGAEVFVHWHVGGHELAQDDLDAAKSWIIRQAFLAEAPGLRS
jgi:phospholipase/carboxylesterase